MPPYCRDQCRNDDDRRKACDRNPANHERQLAASPRRSGFDSAHRAADGNDKSITTSSERLDEHWRVRRFTERFAQPLDRGIETVIEIDKCVRWPEFAAQLLPGDQLSRPFEQRPQHLERLFLEFYLFSLPPQFPSLED